MSEIKMARAWAMPNPDTFDIQPIGEFVKRYLAKSMVSVDPFARNKSWATFTNDLNPETAAQFHLTALDFLQLCVGRGIVADLVVFDPPYTLHQMKQVYQSVGLKFALMEAQQTGVWTREKDLCGKLLARNGVFLHFGHHSNGMGKKRGFEIEEMLIVAHGRAHNDTICIAERRIN